jgi:nucleotide sugar dehydrogenase
MRVAMIGIGYVGLVSGACIADFGHEVTCVDSDRSKVSALNAGEVPIFEPGLADLVRAGVAHGRLTFTTELREPVREADAVFIAVGTPSRRGDGHADLSYVYEATRQIAGALQGFTVVITKSRSRSALATRSNALFASCDRMPISPWSRTPSSCAKAPPSTTSSIRTASSSALMTSEPERLPPRSTGRFA